MVFRCIEPAISNNVFYQLLVVLIVGNIGDLEATGTVGFTCLEVDPELPGAGCEGNGALVGLAGLIGGNGGWGGVLSHDEDVPTLILRWQEDLGYHDKNLALGWGVDVPDALHTSWVVAWVVGGLDIASELTQLPTTLAILALGHTGGAIKVSACVSWTAGAEILTEVRLIGAHGTADAAVDAGVVVVPRGALDFGVTVLEGDGSLMLSGEASTAWEAQGPSCFRLIGATWARLAGLEPICRVLAR